MNKYNNNPILYSLNVTNQIKGNLKSKNTKLIIKNIERDFFDNSIIKSIQNSIYYKSQHKLDQVDDGEKESYINNPFFSKFIENSNLNSSNEKYNNISYFDDIENIDEISDYYTKNLNLSIEEKLIIKNCILMQIINSSITTLNLGVIEVINFSYLISIYY